MSDPALTPTLPLEAAAAAETEADPTWGLANPGNRLGLGVAAVLVVLIVAALATGFRAAFLVAILLVPVAMIIMLQLLLKDHAKPQDFD